MKVTYLSFERVSSRLVASLVPREVPPELISDVEIFGVSETIVWRRGRISNTTPHRRVFSANRCHFRRSDLQHIALIVH